MIRETFGRKSDLK